MSSSSLLRPSRPLQYHRPHILDLSAFGTRVAQEEQKRQDAYDLSRKLQAALTQTRTSVESDDENAATAAVKQLDDLILSSLPSEATRTPREANLSSRMEDYVRLKAFAFFLDTGRLLPPSHCKYATDEEYLAGACMGLSTDLSRYGMGRATARDVISVTVARNLVQEINAELLQFDFRNGPLRRKYDGTKYSLKALETLLYELSITGAKLDDDRTDGPDSKRSRLEDVISRDELEALRGRMEHRDECRETLIKRCRDGQKAAKQSIFALHRGDRKKAAQLISECEKCITADLLPIVEEEPSLRGGSFGGVLEEYVEAKLFYCWLFGKADGPESPTGDLVVPEDFSIELEPADFIGGLCDLTGEIGRYAVQRGTARDTEGVKLCLSTNAAILTALQTIERLPGNTGKKMDQLRRSVEKLERMLYEMSLSEATGRNVKTDVKEEEKESESQ